MSDPRGCKAFSEMEKFFLTGIHSMRDSTAITRHGVTKNRSTKRLRYTGNQFGKNLQLILLMFVNSRLKAI